MICPECRKIIRKELPRNSNDLTNTLAHFGKNRDTRTSNLEQGHGASVYEVPLTPRTYNFQLQPQDLRFVRRDSAIRARRFASRTIC